MQMTNLTSGLVPYIASAAVATFALNYCVQSLGAGLIASDRIGIQSEPAQPINIVDRSHKGDRLSGGQHIYGQAASGDVAIGNMGLLPATAPFNDARQLPSILPKLPDGCESAFSPLSAAERKSLAARCVT